MSNGRLFRHGPSLPAAKAGSVLDSQRTIQIVLGELVGVVAQLVERLVRNEKVAGSIPVGSTSPICASRFPCTSKLDRPCVPTSSMRSLATESAFVLLLWRIRLPPTPFLPKHNPVGATIAPPPSPRPLLHRSGEWACGGDELRHTPTPCSERRKGCGVV